MASANQFLGWIAITSSTFTGIAMRTDHRLALEANISSTKADMCDQWLLAEFDDGSHEAKPGLIGSFRLEEWSDTIVAQKVMGNGCKKSYQARCDQGALVVIMECPNKEKIESEVRCFGPWRHGCTHSRRIDVGESETLTIVLPNQELRTLTSGHISFGTADPSKGVELELPPGYGNWVAEPGCYCCKTDYGFFDRNPFSYSGRRAAWDRDGEDGNAQCMLAWRMIGNGFNHESPSETSFGGVLLLIPEFVATFADMMTGTIARHVACAATCPMRAARFQENAYSFTKIQTEFDKY